MADPEVAPRRYESFGKAPGLRKGVVADKLNYPRPHMDKRHLLIFFPIHDAVFVDTKLCCDILLVQAQFVPALPDMLTEGLRISGVKRGFLDS